MIYLCAQTPNSAYAVLCLMLYCCTALSSVQILEKVKATYDLPLVTDVHESHQVPYANSDVLLSYLAISGANLSMVNKLCFLWTEVAAFEKTSIMCYLFVHLNKTCLNFRLASFIIKSQNVFSKYTENAASVLSIAGIVMFPEIHNFS
jgi:hypothetical protein